MPRFVLQIGETLHFRAFHTGIVVSVPFIMKNRIIFLKYSWSAIEKTVRCLHIYEQVNHVAIIHNQLRAMRPSRGNRNIYSPEDFVRAFSYYALSRSLYQRMRQDFKLPSVSTLSNITSSCSNQTISIFLQNVISCLEDLKKSVFYFTMQHHGGEIFSRAANDFSLLAETRLCQMLICLHGGPKFLINMLPVAQLDAIFCQVEDQRLYVIICYIIKAPLLPSVMMKNAL